MKKETLTLIRRIYRILLSIAIVTAGICLIVACVSIYGSGDQPFSREAVAEAFSPISACIYVCLSMTFISALAYPFLPVEAKKSKNAKSPETVLKLVESKRDLSKAGEAVQSEVITLRKRRKITNAVCLAVCAVCALIFAIYAFNGANFHQSDINTSMIKAMYVMLPCAFVAFSASLVSAYAGRNSMSKEAELLKKCPKKNEESVVSDSGKTALIVKISLLVVGIAALVYGLLAGGAVDVLTKAVNICTECIGLG